MLNPDSDPDYASYSLTSLLDAQAHIDRERYPERAARLDWFVAERRSQGFAAPSPERAQASQRPLAVWLILVYQLWLVLSGAFALLFLMAGGFDAVAPALRARIPRPSLSWSCFSLTRVTLAFGGAIALVQFRRLAAPLFTLALALQVVSIPFLILPYLRSGLSGFVAGTSLLFAIGVSGAICAYSWHLDRQGRLR